MEKRVSEGGQYRPGSHASGPDGKGRGISEGVRPGWLSNGGSALQHSDLGAWEWRAPTGGCWGGRRRIDKRVLAGRAYSSVCYRYLGWLEGRVDCEAGRRRAAQKSTNTFNAIP